jgi:hypothetical protein
VVEEGALRIRRWLRKALCAPLLVEEGAQCIPPLVEERAQCIRRRLRKALRASAAG